MKLQSHVSRKVKGKKYVKHVIVIPSAIIKELDWASGKNVKYQVNGKELVLK